MDLKEKVVVVTGASTGIGRELALKLAKLGARVAVLARTKKLLDELSSHSQDIFPVPADVTEPVSVKNAVRKIVAKFGRIDVLVNNAGVGYWGPVETLELKDMDRLVKTNVYGVISMIQEALPYLKASRGMIVNISSGLTKMNLPLVAPYASTKYMLNALTNAMRIELRTYGIRVVNYLPPMVRTPFYQNNIRAKGSKRTEMGERKMATPQWTADRIIRAMRSGKREASEAGMSGIMNLLMPGFMDNIFYKTMIAGRK